jgi:hypothetical protein
MLNPDDVFAAFWATALEDAHFRENDLACEEGREPCDIYGDPAAEYGDTYRAAIARICEEAAPLMARLDPRFAPRGGDLDSDFGSDLYLTAVGHGAGFWDGDWPPIGDELTKITKRHAPSGDLAEHIDGGYFFI